ncbi:MAG: Stp1/IreP family PP2C-type Ser/Thr phosphatase [Oscillospiraceae bacterium]|nr:Stp1/IreP family PP2C-type Ser/Thr phosphatase [Oscillospiraceae bacterium]
MKVYSKTDIGLVRQSNQDFIINKIFSESTAWSIVCDGMGGAKAGDVASKTAAIKISEFFEFSLEKGPANDMCQLHLEAIKYANKIIFQSTLKNEELKGMGTTVVIAMVYENCLHISHVGDSRAYLIRDDIITQLTVDHSVVQEMVEKGEITEEAAQKHPRKNLITKALGVNETITCDYNKIKVQKNDIIMLCTDGLTNYLNSEEIQKILLENNSENSIDILINQAKNLGGNDNITVSVIEI